MGVENNECVLATTWKREAVDSVWLWVRGLEETWQRNLFTEIDSCVNSKTTIILGPDGSKKGWADAEAGEVLRDRFIEFLKTFDYEDGSSPWSWVEVGYGEFGQKVLRGNNKNCYSDEEYAE